MNTLSDWLRLGGYGQYVWPSYALAVLMVWLNIVWARQSMRKARAAALRRIEVLRTQRPLTSEGSPGSLK